MQESLSVSKDTADCYVQGCGSLEAGAVGFSGWRSLLGVMAGWICHR